MNRYDDAFFQTLDTLIARSEIVIDRPKGTAHPRYRKSYIRRITDICPVRLLWMAAV